MLIPVDERTLARKKPLLEGTTLVWWFTGSVVPFSPFCDGDAKVVHCDRREEHRLRAQREGRQKPNEGTNGMVLIQPCLQRIQKYESGLLGLGESVKVQMDEKRNPFRNGVPNIQVKYYLHCRYAIMPGRR